MIKEILNEYHTLSKIAKQMNLTRDLAKRELDKEISNKTVIFDPELGYFNLLTGTITIKKRGFGFITIPDSTEEFFVSEFDSNGCYNGDTVSFFAYDSNGKLKNASIVSIIDRAHKDMIAKIKETTTKNNIKKYKAISVFDDFNVKAKVFNDKLNGAVDGNICQVKLIYKESYIEAIVDKILGHVDDPGIDITEIAYKYNFINEFSLESNEMLKNIPDHVRDSDLVGLKDFSSDLAITIDGDDSKDFDDAVSLVILPDSNYLLRVYIADVSYYVKKESPLDKDAFKKGTSVYLADRVIPMLPHQLSNGICSLNEGVKRLVMCVSMTITNKGHLENYQIDEGYIISKHRMTYNKVNAILNGDLKLQDEYSDIKDMLFEMAKLSDILRNIRYKKGGLDFDVDEYKFDLNSDSSPKSISIRKRDVGELLIEDFMLKANEVVAYHLSIMELPCLYRVHEKPDQDKLKNVFSMIANMGYTFKAVKNDIHPHIIQETLNSIKDENSKTIISSMVLRSMMKAKYFPKNLGHYGLALDYYCHFTSPIRRYPDLVIQRILKELALNPNNYVNDLDYYKANLDSIALRSSNQERLSIDCERETFDMLSAWYMEKYLKKEFKGIITSITSFGMFVTLESGIEGLVALSNMDGYFTFDDANMTLISVNDKYKLGDTVDIIVVSANKASRNIDFMIKKDYLAIYGGPYENSCD